MDNIIKGIVMEVNKYMSSVFKLLIICGLLLNCFNVNAVVDNSFNKQGKLTQEPKMKFTKESMQQLYNDILVNQKLGKFHDYFTDDCFISINGKVFNANDFKQRMKWIKEHTKSVKVEVVNFFMSEDGTQITDSHISTAIDKHGIKRKVFVMQQSRINDGKIKDFIDATYVIEGDQDMTVVTAK